MFERKKIALAPWEDITGDSELDLVIAALRGLELHDGQARGWGQPARLFILHRLYPGVSAMQARVIPYHIWDHGQGNQIDDLTDYAIGVDNAVIAQLGDGRLLAR